MVVTAKACISGHRAAAPRTAQRSSPLNSRAKRQLSLFKRPHYQQHIGFSLWIGTALVLFGVIVTLTAALNHRRMVRMLNKDQPLTFRPLSVSVIVALALGFLGLLVACYLPLGLNAATSKFEGEPGVAIFETLLEAKMRGRRKENGGTSRAPVCFQFTSVSYPWHETRLDGNCLAHHHP